LLFYGGGLAQTDARMYVEIEEDRSVPPSRYQLEQPDYQRLVAYKRFGTGFVGGGIGLAMNVLPHVDVRVDLGARVTFPTFGFAWTPALSVEVRP
jgi:hypothetical protein